MNDAMRADDAPPEPAYRRYVLAVLVLVYTFSFIDRQIVGILAVPIKAELGLSDRQLGMMGGLAFAIFYTSLGIPIARLADRVSRVNVISVALALWSLMTAVCGLATSFPQLFLARVGVGVGEAGGVAPSHSLICDFFPQPQRGRALSIHSFGIPIGNALGVLGGAYLATRLNWHTAFYVVGLAGLGVVPLLKWTVREPVRGRFDAYAGPATRYRFADVARVLATKRSFWWLSLGAASASTMGYAVFFWMPSFFVRSFGLTLLQASMAFAALVFAGGLVGIWCGGALADRFGARSKAAYALIPAFAFALTVPLYVAGVLSSTLWVSLAVLLAPTALGLVWFGPLYTAVQHLVPAAMRATAAAVFLFVNNLIGLGVGSTLIGALSDALRAREGVESLRYAILAGTGFYVVAALCLLLAARRLERDWVG